MKDCSLWLAGIGIACTEKVLAYRIINVTMLTGFQQTKLESSSPNSIIGTVIKIIPANNFVRLDSSTAYLLI